MRRKLSEFNQRINDYEYKMEMITKEIERLNNIVENKNKEIQNLTGLVQ
jgi:predicted  nucleic acid-binding Zn-ribbon protein